MHADRVWGSAPACTKVKNVPVLWEQHACSFLDCYTGTNATHRSRSAALNGIICMLHPGTALQLKQALTWRGRLMRPEASSIISFHCAIQPTVLATYIPSTGIGQASAIMSASCS